MRLSNIEKAKSSHSGTLQDPSPADISDQIVDEFLIRAAESPKRRLVRLIAPAILTILQPSFRAQVACLLPIKHDALTVGERFARDASLSRLLSCINSDPVTNVLVPGCYQGGEDVQMWLRRRVARLVGIDVYSLAKRWAAIVPQLALHFQSSVTFCQASVESIPFDDNTFDLVASAAVLEHVQNLSAMVSETARVLRSGGWAWHCFGPLYYCWGGDHCISAYGSRAGYDHLLLSDQQYRNRIHDQAFFDRQPDPNLPFWARHNQFSFAKASEYLALFSNNFDIHHVVAIVSEDALAFRKTYPDLWRRLLAAGLTESDLLIKSLALVMRKKP